MQRFEKYSMYTAFRRANTANLAGHGPADVDLLFRGQKNILIVPKRTFFFNATFCVHL